MAKIEIELVNGELAGKSFQEIKKSVNAAGLEVNKAKVGTEEWIKATKKLDEAKKLQADYTKQLQGTTTASNLLKESFNKLPGAQFFNQIGASLGMFKSGVGGLISQFGMLKVAIASSGIGLLVLLLGSLFAWFTKTEEGADKLKSVLYPLQVLFQKLTGILADLGGKVFKRLAEAIDNPKQALKDLGQILLDNVINRFKAFALIGPAIQKIFSKDWAQGLKDLGNATIQVATGVENAIDKVIDLGSEVVDVFSAAYKEGQKLLELENAIEDAEIALTTSRAKLNVQIAEAGELARNSLETDEKRLAAAQRVQALQAQLTAQEERYLQLKRERQKIEQNQDGHLSDEERLEAAKLEAEIVQLQADNIDKNKKARALELNLIESIAKREEEIAKNTASLRVEAMAEGLAKEIAQIELQSQEKIKALTGSEAQIAEQAILLEEIKQQEIQAVRDKYTEKEKAAAEKARKDKEAADKAAFDRELATAEEAANHKNFLLLEQLYDGQITRNEFDKLAQENMRAAFEEQLRILEEHGQAETALYDQIATKILEIDEAKKQKQIANAQQTFNAAVQLGNAIVAAKLSEIERENAAGEKRLAEIEKRSGKESSVYKAAAAQMLTQQKANFEKKKKLEKTQVKINALAEIAGIIKGAVEVGGLYGVILGAVLSAATLVRANSAIKEIDAQKFAYGGYVEGPSHSQGGIKGVVGASKKPIEFEGGEFFFSKRATAALGADNLTRINDRYTKRFANGGPVSPFSNRAPIASGNAGSASTPDVQTQLVDLKTSFDVYAAKVDGWATTLKVQNVATETQAVAKKVDNIINDANV